MTIIAFKDGVMAADTAGFSNAWRVRSLRPKITRFPDGRLVGCAGSTSVICVYLDWLAHGEEPKNKPDVKIDEGDLDVLIARPDGTLWRTVTDLIPYQVESPYAIGSEVASMMALGAMYAGATAGEAVKIAIDHTIYVGGCVQVEPLDAG